MVFLGATLAIFTIPYETLVTLRLKESILSQTQVPELFYLSCRLLFFLLYIFFIDLIILNMQDWRIGYAVTQLLMLHSLKVHFKSFQVDQQKFRPHFNHHLASCHLLCVATFAVKFVPQVKQLFRAELFEAIWKWGIFLNIYGQIHEGLLPGWPSFTSLALGYGHKLSLKHLLDPSLKVD